MALIPRRGQVGQDTPRGRGQRIPGSGDVPTVSPASLRDPGLQTSPAQFGGAEGAAIAGLGQDGLRVANNIATRQLGNERNEADTTFFGELAEKERELQERNDFSDARVKEASAFAEKRQQEILAEHRGGQISTAQLEDRLERRRIAFTDSLAAKNIAASIQRQQKSFNGSFNAVGAAISNDPDVLDGTIPAGEVLEKHVNDFVADAAFNGASQTQIQKMLPKAREEFAKSMVEPLIQGGNTERARELLRDPALTRVLTPGTRRDLFTRADNVDREIQKARGDGVREFDGDLIRLKDNGDVEVLIEGSEEGSRILTPEETAAAGFAPGTVVAQNSDRDFEVLQKPPEPKEQTITLTPEQILEEGLTVPENSIVQRDPGGKITIVREPDQPEPEEAPNFGNSFRGRATNIAVDLARSFGEGTLSQDQEDLFRTSVGILGQPSTRINPDSGLLETTVTPLPPVVVEAFEQRGEEVPSLQSGVSAQPLDPTRGTGRTGVLATTAPATGAPATTAPATGAPATGVLATGAQPAPATGAPATTAPATGAPAATAPATGAPATGTANVLPGSSLERAIPATGDRPATGVADGPTRERAAAQALAQAAADELPTIPAEDTFPSTGDVLANPGARTVAEEVLIGNVTGPVPALTRLFGRFPEEVPFLGSIRSPETTSARQFIAIAEKQLVRALQQNPRFVEGERKAISESLDLEPSLFDNRAAFIDRIIGIDKALEQLQISANEAANGKRALVSGESAQMARDSAVNIARFREILLPPRVETIEQARTFNANVPARTKFMWFDDESQEWKIRKTGGVSPRN